MNRSGNGSRKVLIRYLKPHWKTLLLLALLVIIGTGMQLVNPQIVRYFIDTAHSTGALKALLTAAWIYIGMAVLTQVLNIASVYLSENLAWSTTNALREDLAAHCLQLDMSFHNKRNPGDMIERIDGDVTVLSNFFSQFAVRIASNAILLVGALVMLFREDWRIGLAFLLFSLVALSVLKKLRNIAVKHWGAARQASAVLYGFIEERLSGTEEIRASGAQAFVMRRLYEHMRARLQTERKANLIGGVTWTSTIGFFTIGTAMSLAFGAYLYYAGVLSLGAAYLIYSYVNLLRVPVEQITQQVQDLQRANASIQRTSELLQTVSKVQDGSGAPLPAEALSVQFDDVTFTYGEGKSVLDHLSFRIEAGKVLGLLGRTGSGKTTMVRLLFRQYDPTAGNILLGGRELRDTKLHDLRDRVAMVTQDVQLFKGTVRDNITFFAEESDDQQILAAFRELGLWNWYEQLPAGLDTEITPEGGGLSAGEAQLLAFTRIFLRNPGLVIFDEPSSRLDPATEQLLANTFAKLLHNRTGIIIAHRLQTVEAADQILIIEDGVVLENGGRVELSQDPASRFSHLLQTGMEGVLA